MKKEKEKIRVAQIYPALILHLSAKKRAIDLHFHPQNDITFPFANLPRNYDIFREQSFLIVPTDETGIP